MGNAGCTQAVWCAACVDLQNCVCCPHAPPPPAGPPTPPYALLQQQAKLDEQFTQWSTWPAAPHPHSPSAPQPHTPTAPQPHSPTPPHPDSPPKTHLLPHIKFVWISQVAPACVEPHPDAPPGKLSNTHSFPTSFFTKDSLKVRVADAWRLSDCDWWMTDGSRPMAVDRHPTAVPGWPGLRWSDLLLLAVMAAPPSPLLRCCQRDVFSCSRRRFGVSRSFPKLLLAAVRPAAIDCARPCNRSAAGCPTGGSARPPLHYAAQQTLPYAPITALKVCWTLLPVGGGGGAEQWQSPTTT